MKSLLFVLLLFTAEAFAAPATPVGQINPPTADQAEEHHDPHAVGPRARQELALAGERLPGAEADAGRNPRVGPGHPERGDPAAGAAQEHAQGAPALPAAQRMTGLRGKSLLKSVMAPRLPREILKAPKRGFGVPIEHWLRHELKELAYDTLTSARAKARGLFRPEAVVRLLDEHMAGLRPHHDRIWALLMLELWFAMWIDGDGVAARP